MTEPMTTNGHTEKSGKISLDVLAKMTGFPIEMIKDEIFQGQEGSSEISLDDLRSAMLSYIDSTLLTDEK